MSKAKTKVDKTLVEEFVKKKFASYAESFEVISGGESSQGFFFSSQNNEYVIRVNKRVFGFEKDKYAYQAFHSSEILIPETFMLGKLTDELYFSITKRAAGKLFSELNRKETAGAIHTIIQTLDAIHSIDISNTSGFGSFDTQGKANLKSFRDHLEKLITEMPEDYEKEAGNKLLEKNIIVGLLEKYKTLLDYSSDVRSLVHADFGFSNTTVDNNEITGIFDWEHAMYGDFLYDVAWLDFWGNRESSKIKVDYKNIFLKHYQERGTDIKNYNERILLYKLNFGIGAMMFFVRSEQEKKYSDTKAHLLGLTKDL